MACSNITVGVPKDCTANAGGITNIWITDFENVLSVTASGGEISAITMASGAVFYEYIFNKFTSTFAEKGTISIENGTLFHEQTVTLKLARRNKTTRNALAMLLQKDLAIIVKDANSLYWMIGEANGANMTELPSESGTQMGDFNGYTISFLAREPVQAQEIQESAVTSVIA